MLDITVLIVQTAFITKKLNLKLNYKVKTTVEVYDKYLDKTTIFVKPKFTLTLYLISVQLKGINRMH